jgi:autotransporter-associated beta strand protein
MRSCLYGGTRRLAARVAVAALIACVAHSVRAATSETWVGTTDATWANSANWSPTVTPGDTDTATFNAGSPNTTIDLGAGITIGTVAFDTAGAVAYTIGAGAVGSQALTLSNAGAITLSATVTAPELFNANLVLGTDGTAQAFTVTNNAAVTGPAITFAGGISGSNGAGVKTLTIAGTGNVVVSGNISNGTGGTVALTKSIAGTLTLSGTANSYTGATSVSAGVLSLTGVLGSAATPAGSFTQAASASTVNVAGGTLVAASFTQNNNAAVLNLTNNGTMTINGTFRVGANNASSNGTVTLTSGTLSANNLDIGRSGLNVGTLPTSGSTTVGVYVNGATVTATNLTLGFSSSVNSTPNFRMDSGSTTVSGNTTITISGTGNARFSQMDINGGTYSTNTTLIGGNFATSRGVLIVRGTGVYTTNTLTFGNATQTVNDDTLQLLGGTMYIGAGGMVVGTATPAYATAINFGSAGAAAAPVLGAVANWSTTMGMTLVNSTTAGAVSVKAADASNIAHDITLGGALTGSGGLNKTGGGVLTLNAANNYGGGTTVSAGSLVVGDAGHTGAAIGAVTVSGGTVGGYGTVGALTVNGGATLAPGGSIGTLNAATTVLSGNYLDEIDSASSDKLAVTGNLTLGGTLTVSDLTGGTGPYAASYVIATYTGVLGGAFSSVTSGYTVDTTSTVGQVLLIKSPTAPVPEPASLGMLALGAAALLKRRRR